MSSRAAAAAAPESSAARPRSTSTSKCAQVELAVLDSEAIADALRLDPLGAERPAKAVDVDLERLLRRGGRFLTPDGVDQPVARDDLAGMQQEGREERTLLRRAESERAPVFNGRKRPEQPELRHRPPLSSRQADLKRRP